MSARRSSRSSRAATPRVVSSAAGQQHPGADQLELQPRRGGAAHLGQAEVDDVGGPGQLGGAEVGGLLAHPLQLVGRVVAEDRPGGVGHGVHDDQVAQPLEQVLGEPARVVAGLDHLVDDPEHRRRVTGRERLDRVVEQVGVGEAEQPRGVLVADALVRRPGR